MTERLRLFVGSEELNFETAWIIKTNDHLVDEAKINIEANANVTNTSVIDFKKSDGSTVTFAAKFIEKKEKDFWRMRLFTNAFELQNLRVDNVYENMSPEAIVQDAVERTSSLSFTSTASSGFTITKYIAKSYAIDIIRDMMDVLQWQFRVDENDTAFFEPQGEKNNGRTFTHGTNIQITEWEEDKNEMFNKVKIIGGFESFATTEGSGSSGTTFFLVHKPSGSMLVGSATPGGTVEIDPGEYTVDAENQNVIFDDVKTNPSFDYSFDRPVVVENQDDGSITDFGEIFEEFQAPWLDTFSDARKYSQNLLDARSSPEVKTKGIEPDINFDAEVGELVNVIDQVRGKEEQLVITKITIKGELGQTEYEFGSRDFVFFDWQRLVQERIKKLERRFINEDEIIFTRLFKHTSQGTVNINNVWEYNSPEDSFILGHTTLGRLRDSFDFEADCSGSANGDWIGSGIGSAQFGTAGFRLGKGAFNGTDNEVTVSDTISGVQSVSIAIKPDTNNRNICQLTSSDIISINSSNQITTSGLANVTIYVNNIETNTITLNQFNNVVVTFDAVSSDAIKVGHSTSWFSGDIDEFALFNKKISSNERASIISKVFYSNQNLYSNCLLWLSMDNPTLGDRSSARQAV